jgi:hypothetical protein
MATSILRDLKSLVARKRSVRQREQSLIAELGSALPRMGYTIVPSAGSGGGDAAAPLRKTSHLRKTLACPHCPRRFGHRLHVARHISATHPRERAAAAKVEVRKPARKRRVKK